MCKHGEEVLMLVPIPASLASDGRFRWDVKDVDRCISQLVKALNDAGIYTAGCCCGHGKSDGSIVLHDGSILVIKDAPNNGLHATGQAAALTTSTDSGA